MRDLVAALGDWNLSWQESKKLEAPKQIPTREMTAKMEVKLLSSVGQIEHSLTLSGSAKGLLHWMQH
jgi:hypothetical protein